MNELLDALGYVGSSLDKPGRAVRGLLGGRPDELAALMPFSDSLGITDPGNAVSGEDLLRHTGIDTGTSWGNHLLGFGAEVALDPTTYLGGFLGRMGGKALGKGMEAAAKLRGPRYATSADDLLGLLGQFKNEPHSTHVLRGVAEDTPELFQKIAREVPPGSVPLGAGDEAVAFKTPSGRALRLGWADQAQQGRPLSDTVLQADRSVGYKVPLEQTAPYGVDPKQVLVENLPMAEKAGDVPFWTRTPMGDRGMPGTIMMKRRASNEGLRFSDAHAGNLGMIEGQPKIIDPGAVTPEAGYKGGFQPIDEPREPSLMMRALLGVGGGDAAMQGALESGLAAPKYRQSFGRTGLGLGAALPSLFRQPGGLQ